MNWFNMSIHGWRKNRNNVPNRRAALKSRINRLPAVKNARFFLSKHRMQLYLQSFNDFFWITGISYDIMSGEKIGIVGRTGARKSRINRLPHDFSRQTTKRSCRFSHLTIFFFNYRYQLWHHEWRKNRNRRPNGCREIVSYLSFVSHHRIGRGRRVHLHRWRKHRPNGPVCITEPIDHYPSRSCAFFWHSKVTRNTYGYIWWQNLRNYLVCISSRKYSKVTGND